MSDKQITDTDILIDLVRLAKTQAGFAETYAGAIRSGDDIDWHAVARAIKTRWSKSGLIRVKTMAWKILRLAGGGR